jgi:predicted Ser/Thr protein kinase
MQDVLMPSWGLLGLTCLLVFVLLVVAAVLAMVNAARSGRRPAAPLPGPRDGRPREPRPVPARRSDPVPVANGNCPECGTRLDPDSPEGLCPQCLLKGALDDSPGLPDERKVRTTPHGGPFAAPTPDELAPHFPHLEILELIGQGGMGAVYKARHIKLDRFVALKVLPPEWDSDPAFAERFAREARTLARLNHPHVVAVHDFGEAGGLFYLVMEYVDGPNLREVLQAGRLAPEQALALVPQLCDALQYAHEEEVVHRDIKPENILLDRRGRVKIADFGLAKLLNRPRADFTLTGSRQVMGTLDYMAPEQRHSPLAIDHRADIYSLGVVFYEMLTGELPLGHFPPPSEKAAVDARLDGVVLRALKTDPGQRYQSVHDVKTDVESIAGGKAAPAPPVSGPVQPVIDATEAQIGWHQVQAPAVGLFAVGLLTPLAWFVALVVATMHDPRWMDDPNLVFATDGVTPPPMLFAFMVIFSLMPATILVAGALKMKECDAYELVFLACLVALSPFTGFVWLLSMPIGIWAIIILAKRRVRVAFELQLRKKAGLANWRPLPGRPAASGPFRRPRRSFLRSFWTMFFTTPRDPSELSAREHS